MKNKPVGWKFCTSNRFAFLTKRLVEIGNRCDNNLLFVEEILTFLFYLILVYPTFWVSKMVVGGIGGHGLTVGYIYSYVRPVWAALYTRTCILYPVPGSF